MGYQIKLQVLSKPKTELGPAERKALEMGFEDVATFLVNTLEANTPKRSGKLVNSIRKLVFRIQLSAKAFYDLSVAPYALEVMRGNKTTRVIEARQLAFSSRKHVLKFVTRSGETLYRSKVTRQPTLGLRIPSKMRDSQAVNARARQILLAHLSNALSGEKIAVDTTAVTL